MSEQITVYDRVADTQAAIATLALNIAKSSMFACENEGQAYILALECFARRCTPVDLLSRYHLIKGKLTLKANVMLAEANARGWLHTVKRRDVDGAAIVLRHESNPEHAVEVALTWEQARAEPFVYEGKESDVVKLLAAGKTPQLKSKYATPRARMQMLWARVVSDVVNACCPEAACGLYPPEVVADFDSDRDYSWSDEDTQQMRKSSPAGRSKPVKKVSAVVADHVETQALPAGPTADEAPRSVEDAVRHDAVEYVRRNDKRDSPAGPVEVISTAPATATDKQIADLRGLSELLRLTTQQIGDCLREHGADRFAGLSRAAADKIAGVWHNLAAETVQVKEELVEPAEERAAIVSVESQQEAEDAYAMSIDEPCSAEQVEQIKALVVEASQISPDLLDRLRQKLRDSGLKKIADLSFGDARRLINLLEVRAVEAFFASKLTREVPF